jgi:hypothetical protein
MLRVFLTGLADALGYAVVGLVLLAQLFLGFVAALASKDILEAYLYGLLVGLLLC